MFLTTYANATELIFDCPGGGFVAMTPAHHEERLRLWGVHSKKPVLALEYGKAPECEDRFPNACSASIGQLH